MLQDTPDLTSFNMDAEIVVIDPMSGELKSFQELSNHTRNDMSIKDNPGRSLHYTMLSI